MLEALDFFGVSFFPAVCGLFRCVLDGERWVGGWVGRCPGKKVTLEAFDFWGSHFSLLCACFSVACVKARGV